MAARDPSTSPSGDSGLRLTRMTETTRGIMKNDVYYRQPPAGKGERQMSEGVVLHRPSTWPVSEKGECRDEVRRAILMKEDKHGENPPVLPAPGGKDAGGEVQNRLRITR